MIYKLYWVYCFIDKVASSTPHYYYESQASTSYQMNIQEPWVENPVRVSAIPCCRICQYNGSESYETSNFEWRNGTIVFNECSLFQLVNNQSFPIELPDELFQPAHLSCSLFRILVYVNFYRKKYETNMAMANILQYESTDSYSARVKLELDWILNVIKSITLVPISYKENSMIIINGMPIFSDINLDSIWILEHVSKNLPDFCSNYIICHLYGWDLKQCGTDQPLKDFLGTPLPNIFDNPYLPYIQTSVKIQEVFKKYSSIKCGDQDTSTIQDIITKMYESFTNRVEKEVLQSILLFQMFSGQATNQSKLVDFLSTFSIDPTAANWTEMIYKMCKFKIKGNIFAFGKKASSLNNFIKYHDETRTVQSLRLINLFIAKILLHGPFIFVIPLCCVLFYENLTQNFSTWMTIRYSLFIRLLSSKIKYNQTGETYDKYWFATAKMKYWSRIPFNKFVEYVSNDVIDNVYKKIKYASHLFCNVEILRKVQNLLISIYCDVAEFDEAV